MKKWIWIVAAVVLAPLLLVGGGAIGIRTESSRQKVVMQQDGYLILYYGQRKPNQSVPFFITRCVYWSGWRERIRLTLDMDGKPVPCPLLVIPA